ncbi:MAG: hypothetical protein P1S60_17445, partial [Anaerolineae bacterium]|nr:hypothetical protein [Anaerolineae bacterium]
AKKSLDKVWFGIFLLACVPVYTAVMLGPWGWLKNTAYAVGTTTWFGYAIAFLAITLLIIPGLYTLSVLTGWLWSGKSQGFQISFINFGYALTPLGMLSWIAFTISFAFNKLAYIWPVLSDPFGWGWNLFGTARWPWQPYLVSMTPLLQVLALFTGLIWTGVLLYKNHSVKPAFPVWLFVCTYSVVLLWLLL